MDIRHAEVKGGGGNSDKKRDYTDYLSDESSVYGDDETVAMLEERLAAYDVCEYWRRAEREIQRLSEEGKALLDEQGRAAIAKGTKKRRISSVARFHPQQLLSPSPTPVVSLARTAQSPFQIASPVTTSEKTATASPIDTTRLSDGAIQSAGPLQPLRDASYTEYLLSRPTSTLKDLKHLDPIMQTRPTRQAPGTAQDRSQLPLSTSASRLGSTKKGSTSSPTTAYPQQR